MPHQALSTQEIHTLFIEEISDAGGVGSDTFDDGNCLFARSILPWVADVRPRDEMKGGVALRAAEGEIAIHPYLFRTVCRNGAILAHAIQARQVENYDFRLREEVTQELREAVRTCCQEEVFTGAAQEVRLTVHREVDRALALMSFLSRLPSALQAEIVRQIVSRFSEDHERSQFALANAVTSLARDTRDPELRWRLEEFGGGLLTARTPSPSFDPSQARVVRELAKQFGAALVGPALANPQVEEDVSRPAEEASYV